MKRWGRCLPAYPRTNSFRHIRAALHGHLGDAREGVTIFTREQRLITDDKNIGKVGKGEVRANGSAAATIGFSLDTLGEFLAKLGVRDAASPQDSFGVQAFMRILLFVCDALGVDISGENIFDDFNAELHEQFLSLGRKIFRERGEYPGSTLH